MGIVAHHLEIEWDSPEIARRIDVSTYPVELVQTDFRTLHAEVSIFRNFAPWLGLCLTAELAGVVPTTIDANGGRHPWLKITGADGVSWWVPATGWSKVAGRHVAEMHRSFGTYRVELGLNRQLVIDAVASELDRAHVQEYLDDFRDELVWLALGRPTGASGEAGGNDGRDLIEAISEFAAASRQVLEHPSKDLREVSALVPVARLRPNAATFRAAVRRPDARHLPGRQALESVDTPENRFVHAMMRHCMALAAAVGSSAARRQAHLLARSDRETAKATELLSIDMVDVDPEVFDNQVADMQRRLDAISAWGAQSNLPNQGQRRYRLAVGKAFRGKDAEREFFYRNLDGEDTGAGFSVARFPSDLAELILEAKAIDRELSLSVAGNVRMTSFETSHGKRGRRAIFDSVRSIEAVSPLLSRRRSVRSDYERNGWRRPLTSRERREYQAEAETAKARASRLNARHRSSSESAELASALRQALSRQSDQWSEAGVLPNSSFPMGMTFVQNPAYAGVLAAFHRVRDLEKNAGLSNDALDRLGAINVLHSSALYERWCLIKIISVLVEDFGFVPQADWMEHIVRFSTSSGGPDDIGFRVHLKRSSPQITAQLDVEPVLANGRRPDFRLRFEMPSAERRSSTFSNVEDSPSGLIMDAKFRTRWRTGELPAMLSDLVDRKDYGQDGDRVFILHPAKAAISHRTSPLAWGADCDYGHDQPTGHRKGSVQLGADPVAPGASTLNLRRLIALELQNVFPEPEFAEESDSSAFAAGSACISNATFCITCGNGHALDDIDQKLTERGNPKWFYTCSECRAQTMRTHCFGCGTVLHKNGLQMTYHLTIADQVSNVVCQDCGANFGI